MLGLGCQLPNPAFNGDGDTTGTSDTSDTTAGNTSASTSASTSTTTGDGDTATSDDGPPDTGMEAPDDGPKLDMMADGCDVPTTEGLWPRFGAPAQFDNQQCAGSVNKYVKLIAQDNGDWVVNTCEELCANCNDGQELIVSAKSLDLATLIPPQELNSNQPWIGCYFVQAAPLLYPENDACIYGSLSIHSDEGPGSQLLFNANRESNGLTMSAVGKIGNWQPQLADQLEADQCACAELDMDCCPNHTVTAKKFLLGNNVTVYPGEDDLTTIAQQPWQFWGVQAQSGVVCELTPETSWAIQWMN
ncbi:hypothetical protein DB30_03842 [Enhygromyxa salina]|uniref:Uncharacterized protein n=1 Tax=Enhygromyxa salina TaxID=215803 RepID=A0A0C2D843_9BACT|nr:hypothetical protein DB30_03842 [Enhygromyxa salina]